MSNTQHPNLDELRRYFSHLPKENLINADELQEKIYNTCARSFLDGNQDQLLIDFFLEHKRRGEYWQDEYLKNFHNPDLTEVGRKRLEKKFQEREYFHLWEEMEIKGIIEFLNKQSRHQWSIRLRRLLKVD